MRGNNMKPENLEAHVLKRLTRKRGDVFLRDDFSDLGGWHSPIDTCSHSGGNHVLGYLRRHQSIGRVAKGLYSLFSIGRCTFARQGEVLPFRRPPVYKLSSALYIRKLVWLNSAIQREHLFGRRCAHPSSL